MVLWKCCKKHLEKQSEDLDLLFSTRDDTDLFSFKETKTIDKFEPDVIINAAAKVEVF